MALSHKQGFGNNASATSVQVTFTPQAVGGILLVVCGFNSTSASDMTISSDHGAGITWTPLFAMATFPTLPLQYRVWWGVVDSTASLTITVTATGGSNSFIDVLGDEYAGTDTTNPVDVQQITESTATPNPFRSAAKATNFADEAWWGFYFGSGGDGVVGDSWTQSGFDGATSYTEWRIVSATSSGAQTFFEMTNIDAGVTGFVAIKEPAGPTGDQITLTGKFNLVIA